MKRSYWKHLAIGFIVGCVLTAIVVVGLSITRVDETRATAHALCSAAGGVLIVNRDSSTACVASPINK